MKKPSSKIREEIARLQEQLRETETTEATRLGRLVLKFAMIQDGMSEAEFVAAFEADARRFREAAPLRKPNASSPTSGSGQET